MYYYLKSTFVWIYLCFYRSLWFTIPFCICVFPLDITAIWISLLRTIFNKYLFVGNSGILLFLFLLFFPSYCWKVNSPRIPISQQLFFLRILKYHSLSSGFHDCCRGKKNQAIYNAFVETSLLSSWFTDLSALIALHFSIVYMWWEFLLLYCLEIFFTFQIWGWVVFSN